MVIPSSESKQLSEIGEIKLLLVIKHVCLQFIIRKGKTAGTFLHGNLQQETWADILP